MKNARKIFDLGQLILVLGSLLYIVDLLLFESWTMILIITPIYLVALALILVGWIGTREERQARKAQEKAEKAQKNGVAA